MKGCLGILALLGALLYFVMPWDLDYLHPVGRIDDMVILGLAVYYYWKQLRALSSGNRRAGKKPRAGTGDGDSDRAAEEAPQNPYHILGVEPGDDEKTIRKAYRRLMSQYHPDRVQHLGEEFQVLASKRAAVINDAYERISEERGFS